MKKKIIAAVVICGVFALGAGAGMLAAENAYGSETDPLITKSYLDTTVSEQVEEKIDAKLDTTTADLKAKLDSKISAFEDEIEDAIGGGTVVANSDVFRVVTLSDGDILKCDVGTELMLRIGEAQAWGDDYPALVNITSSSSLYSGTGLTENNMYMVTIKNCGVKSTSDDTKILVRGTYTIE